MKTSRSVFVVGAGFGGMAAALRMRAKNYEVTLLERGDALGGRARVFKQDGFVFDAGPTVITAPYLLEELFTLFGRNPEDYLQLVHLEHWYRYVFTDGTHFDYVADEQTLLKNIYSIAPYDVKGYQKLAALSEKVFVKGFVELADQPFLSLLSMLKHVPALLKLGFYRSFYRAVSHHLQSEKLRKVFTSPSLLVGGNPFCTTSLYLLIHRLERAFGCHFCMGGMHAIVNALQKLMSEVGINIRYHTTVTKIHKSASRLTGLTLNESEYVNCDRVIYNGDPAFAYTHLLDQRKRWHKLRVKKLKFSMSVFVFYFGVNRQYHDVPLHTIIYGNSYQALLQDIFHRHKLNHDISIYLYHPTALDPSLAPAGCDTFYALVPVPNLKCEVDWQHYADTFKQHIIKTLEKRLLTNLSSHIVTQKYVTPDYFKDELLSEHGSAFSIQPLFTQSAYFRFHNTTQQCKGLYFVGAGTHPGAGLPGVLSSAKVLDKLIPELI